MSTKLIRVLLWLAFLVALPMPYWLFEAGRVPTLWLGELTAFVLAMLLSEGGRVTRVVAMLFTAQTLLFVGVTYGLARAVARGIARVPSAGARTALAIATALLVLGASLLPLYRSPLVAGGAPVNVLALFHGNEPGSGPPVRAAVTTHAFGDPARPARSGDDPPPAPAAS